MQFPIQDKDIHMSKERNQQENSCETEYGRIQGNVQKSCFLSQSENTVKVMKPYGYYKMLENLSNENIFQTST